MAKTKIVYFCQECGQDSPKWLGRCPACKQWNTLVEERIRPEARGANPSGITQSQPPLPITEIPMDETKRICTGIDEFDRILGGGLVPGSVTLIGGEPGVGKSTLMLQIVHRLANSSENLESSQLLYITGEESAMQTRMRAERLSATHKNLLVQCETDVETIISTLEKVKPVAAIIDSIQTLHSPHIASAPGSVAQIRDGAAQLVRYAKQSGLALFFIGHVTKEGIVAGPRLLEHMVDTVLYFEGERHFAFRILRAVKNRFGSTNEIGIFEMTDKGLQQVNNPSEMFLSERAQENAGSVVLAAIEGSRPLLVEVQALVSAGAGGTPRRSTHGMDPRRLSLILAVLEKRLQLPLSNADVFVNITGGIQISETALDLAVAAAVTSSIIDQPLESGVVVFGEVGLAGEVRSVGQVDKRHHEAKRLGFERCVYGSPKNEKPKTIDGFTLHPASSLEEALRLLGLNRRG